MAFQAAPLPHEYMLVGIIGFFVSVFWLAGISKTWSFAIGLFCLLLVIASFLSMGTDATDEATLDIIGGPQYAAKKRKTIAHKRS